MPSSPSSTQRSAALWVQQEAISQDREQKCEQKPVLVRSLRLGASRFVWTCFPSRFPITEMHFCPSEEPWKPNIHTDTVLMCASEELIIFSVLQKTLE